MSESTLADLSDLNSTDSPETLQKKLGYRSGLAELDRLITAEQEELAEQQTQ